MPPLLVIEELWMEVVWPQASPTIVGAWADMSVSVCPSSPMTPAPLGYWEH